MPSGKLISIRAWRAYINLQAIVFESHSLRGHVCVYTCSQNQTSNIYQTELLMLSTNLYDSMHQTDILINTKFIVVNKHSAEHSREYAVVG